MAEAEQEKNRMAEGDEPVDEGSTGAAEGQAKDAEAAPVLSKNQQKKLAKRARIVEQRTERRQNRKEQVLSLTICQHHFSSVSDTVVFVFVSDCISAAVFPDFSSVSVSICLSLGCVGCMRAFQLVSSHFIPVL